MSFAAVEEHLIWDFYWFYHFRLKRNYGWNYSVYRIDAQVRQRLTCLLLFIILIQKEIGHAHTLLIIRITVEFGAKSAVSTTCLYMIIALTRYATFCLFFVKFAISMFSL